MQVLDCTSWFCLVAWGWCICCCAAQKSDIFLDGTCKFCTHFDHDVSAAFRSWCKCCRSSDPSYVDSASCFQPCRKCCHFSNRPKRFTHASPLTASCVQFFETLRVHIWTVPKTVSCNCGFLSASWRSCETKLNLLRPNTSSGDFKYFRPYICMTPATYMRS